MNFDKIKEQLSHLDEDERKQLWKKMDKELDDYIDNLENGSSKYVDGWSEDNWESEMENHPFFSKNCDAGKELSPLMKGIQDLKYSPDENTPEELAKNYKEDGNFNFKYKKYRFAVASYSEGLKQKCENPLLNAQLLTNRAAAQFHLQNYRSSLMDCRLAYKILPDHSKALHRAIECCMKLERYDECLSWCEKVLEKEPQSAFASETRKEAKIKKAERLRNERRDVAKAKREQKEVDFLLKAISERGITIEGKTSKDLEPTHPALVGRRKVRLDTENRLIWPVLFLYPEYGETDFIEEFAEDQIFADHILAMFDEHDTPPPWDVVERKYLSDRIRVYFEDLKEQKLVQVDTGKSLKSVLSDKRYRILGGTPAFIILSDGSKFHKEFLNKYK